MELFTMGGHGIYVWSAYLLTTLVLIGIAWYPFIRLSRFKEIARKDDELS